MVAAAGQDLAVAGDHDRFGPGRLFPDHFFDLYQILSENTLDKGELTQKITQESADDRLMKILKQLKDGHPAGIQFSYEILLKRQELAALAGLSLETTIRTVKKMERDGILIIKNGKIFY